MSKLEPLHEVALNGGVNQVRRVGNTVVRPSGLHTVAVHTLLRHLRDNGFEAGPMARELDPTSETETVSWVEGNVIEYPLRDHRTDAVLVSAAQLLRSLHDASHRFDFESVSDWYVPPIEPHEVICHGDFSPYNCTVSDGNVCGVFDFDTAHPGPRLADVGYAVYRWVPLDAPDRNNPEAVYEQRRRLHIFCESYGAQDSVSVVLDFAVERLEWLIGHMLHQAESGHEMFRSHIDAGHHLIYRDAIAHIVNARRQLI